MRKSGLNAFGLGCILLILLLGGCGSTHELTEDEKAAEQVVQAAGYRITSYLGEVHRYILDRSMLYGSTESIPYQQAWGVQKVEPEAYFGQEIRIVGFLVRDHPLERIYDLKTSVYLMITGGKVIGGYAFPAGEGMAGAYYSLDGKTLEEVTGLTYPEWSERWRAKYGGG